MADIREGTNYKTLPEMCMILHMHHSGSSDPLSDEDYLAGVEYVKARVWSWETMRNGDRWVRFDTAVLGLCLSVLEEAKAYVETMPKRAIITAP